MDELFKETLKQYGPVGVFFLIWIYREFGIPYIKKSNNTWVSYEDIASRMKVIEEKIEKHEAKDNFIHEDFKIMKATQYQINQQLKENDTSLKDTLQEMKQDMKETFKMIGEIKTFLMERAK